MAVFEMIFGAIQDFIAGKPEKRRSRGWRKLQKEHLKKNPACAATGSKKRVQVHHIWPVWLFPEKELDPDNLITLGRWWHFILAHFGNYKLYNKDILRDVIIFKQKIKQWRKK